MASCSHVCGVGWWLWNSSMGNKRQPFPSQHLALMLLQWEWLFPPLQKHCWFLSLTRTSTALVQQWGFWQNVAKNLSPPKHLQNSSSFRSIGTWVWIPSGARCAEVLPAGVYKEWGLVLLPDSAWNGSCSALEIICCNLEPVNPKLRQVCKPWERLGLKTEFLCCVA